MGALQIRTRDKPDYDLLIRPDASPDDVYVLVTGRAPRFNVVGWIVARDAMRPEWSQTYGSRPAAYFVPQEALHDMDALGPVPNRVAASLPAEAGVRGPGDEWRADS